MQSSFSVKSSKLKLLQDLVKQYDMRFVHNPFILNDSARVTIDGNNQDMSKINEFFHKWNMLNTNIREIPQKTKFQRFVNKIKKILA